MSANKFDMPGQTKELDMGPANAAANEASLIFYETLHQQRPDSDMATRWLLQHGKLSYEEATAAAKRLAKDKKAAAVANSSKRKPKARPLLRHAHMPSAHFTRQASPQADDDDFQKKPAKKPTAKKKPVVQPDSSDDEDEDFQDTKKKTAAKKPTAKPTAKKPAPKKSAPKKPNIKADDSSDEDEPLSQKQRPAATEDSSEDEAPLSQRKR